MNNARIVKFTLALSVVFFALFQKSVFAQAQEAATAMTVGISSSAALDAAENYFKKHCAVGFGDKESLPDFGPYQKEVRKGACVASANARKNKIRQNLVNAFSVLPPEVKTVLAGNCQGAFWDIHHCWFSEALKFQKSCEGFSDDQACRNLSLGIGYLAAALSNHIFYARISHLLGPRSTELPTSEALYVDPMSIPTRSGSLPENPGAVLVVVGEKKKSEPAKEEAERPVAVVKNEKKPAVPAGSSESAPEDAAVLAASPTASVANVIPAPSSSAVASAPASSATEGVAAAASASSSAAAQVASTGLSQEELEKLRLAAEAERREIEDKQAAAYKEKYEQAKSQQGKIIYGERYFSNRYRRFRNSNPDLPQDALEPLLIASTISRELSRDLGKVTLYNFAEEAPKAARAFCKKVIETTRSSLARLNASAEKSDDESLLKTRDAVKSFLDEVAQDCAILDDESRQVEVTKIVLNRNSADSALRQKFCSLQTAGREALRDFFEKKKAAASSGDSSGDKPELVGIYDYFPKEIISCD